MGILYNCAILVAAVGTFMSFWLGARFTADDAFITWRYGKNLVETGHWNYNPSAFDLTQAYTNPVYAVLSIIPNLLGIDVVWFFKIFSLFTLIAFSVWYLVVSKRSYFMLLMLFSLPATMIHAFGGLETFLYVALVTVLLVALDTRKEALAVVVTLLLFSVRPEAWMLAGLVPLYFALNGFQSDERLLGRSVDLSRFHLALDWNKLLKLLLCLCTPLCLYFWFHFFYFGNLLPNTFYAKVAPSFSLRDFATFCFFISPLLILLPLKKYREFLFTGIFFLVIAINYSKSYLMMNYGARFAYHIFVPIYCYLVFVAAQLDRKTASFHLDNAPLFNASARVVMNVILTLYFLFFVMFTGVRAISLFTYYPRAIDAHAILGQVLGAKNADHVQAFLIGDAGMAAYHSNRIVLDSVGLGSSAVTKTGLSKELLDSYSIDLIAFYGNPDEILKDLFHQSLIYEWAMERGFIYQCDIYWRGDYTFKIYAKSTLPGLHQACLTSRLSNNIGESEYFSKTAALPPWRYWRE
jgi:hypothetical protein